MSSLIPYLNFPGTCEEALNFYASALNGQIIALQRFGDGPAMPGANPDHVLHAQFQGPDFLIMASDSPYAADAQPSARISLSLDFKSLDAINSTFEKMAQGGEITMPLQDTFWGARFGMCRDRFGIHWMFNHDYAPKEAGQSETMMA